MSEDTKLKELIINTLSPEQFEPITPSETEIYLVEDDVEYASVDELNQGLATKQDVISDLDTIRANASLVSTKQDIISDLETIRSNAQDGKNIIPQVNVNTQRIEDLTTAKFPNVVIVGTPHIEGGQVSNYSDTSYLQFPFVDISRGQPFDIYFSFTTAQDVTTQQNILDAYFGIALAIQNGKGIMALSSNGTSWDIGTSVGTNTLLPNTTYYVKYSWTGTEYNAALSTDDQTYVPDMNLASTLSPHKTTIFIGGSPNIFGAGSAHPFKGTINFNKSKVVVNGITVWEGMADVGLASRANVSLNNLDEVGEGRFNAKQDKLPTLENGKFLTNNGSTLSWSSVEALPSQTGNDGKFLTTNGTTASWGDALENKATGNYSLTIIGTATTEEKSTNIGSYSSARAKETTAVGANAGASGERAIAIGCQSVVNANNYGAISIGAYSAAANNSSYSIVLGYNAFVLGQYAIQLGCGTNNEANSFYVGLSNSNNYKLLGLDGKIPSGRIPDLSSTYASTTALDSKQDTLVSGTNIKTIGGESLLGSGDIEVSSYHPSLLSFQWTDHLLNDMSWLRADTFSWQDGNVYKTAYNTLVEEYATGTTETEGNITFKRTSNGFKIANSDMESAILGKYNTDGIAWYYILDTANRKFKLPRTKFGFEGLRTNVGSDIAESLPNIKGEFSLTRQNNANSLVYSTGAFYDNGYSSATDQCYWSTDKTSNYEIAGFDASRSSSIYHDNAPVQERATQMYLYFYVGEFSQTAIEQTAGLNAELFNGKADISASNFNSQGKSLISSLCMPSNRYINLTLGASGSTYTAPANGWLHIAWNGTNADAYCSLDSSYINKLSCDVHGDLNYATNTLAVKKGTAVSIYYRNLIVRRFAFIYAEGENS